MTMRDFPKVGPHTLKQGNEVVSAGEPKCSSWDTSKFKGPNMKANVTGGRERTGWWGGQEWHISYEILLKWNKTKEKKTQSKDSRYWLKINGMNIFWAKNQCDMFPGMYLWYSRAGKFREECLLETKHLGFIQKSTKARSLGPPEVQELCSGDQCHSRQLPYSTNKQRKMP